MLSASTSMRLRQSHHQHRSHGAFQIGKTDRVLAWGMLAVLLACLLLLAWVALRLPPQAGLPFPYAIHP